MKPRMKIATEGFLFGRVPKYPSFYWFWGSKETSWTDMREATFNIFLLWGISIDSEHCEWQLYYNRKLRFDHRSSTVQNIFKIKIFTNLAEDPFWCCWNAGRPGRKCNGFPVLSRDSHPAWNSDSLISSKDSLICYRGSPACRRCSPAYCSCSPAWCKDSPVCCSPSNSWLRCLLCL